ncbi:hypothetical protein KTN05_14185 [Paracoccus sp. Z118]|uniref:Wzz/FepE/Etk N-terminal domain-containing protein n=1 Tax=Paracoccus sp. Z118 TaxID=2851017 RepID=UPI001C2BFC68|nr:Wzz/FepE/Etk N-terminal domain-containing protein [Paracoccus sp. Z118]MBV0892984.1 hypothetical protein [Paracoccus sp. Z118]
MNQINNIPERPLRLAEARAAARPAAAFTLADVFDAIRRSPLLVVLLTAIGGGGAFMVAKIMPETYEATAKIISDADRSGLIALGGVEQVSNTEDSATATIVETIDTPVALGHALDSLPAELQAALRGTIEFPPEAANDPALQRAMLIRHMSGNLDVTHSGRSYVVEVTYNSESPQLSAAVANAVADGYLRSRSELRLNVYRQMLANLEKEIEELTNSLALAERRAQTTRERGRLMSMRFETLTGQKQDEAIEASAGVYAQQREAEREVEATAAVYERLLLEHRQIQSRIGAPELTVQLFAPAVVPLSPAGFNAKPVILALGLMAGFLGGASLAILRNAWRRRARRV